MLLLNCLFAFICLQEEWKERVFKFQGSPWIAGEEGGLTPYLKFRGYFHPHFQILESDFIRPKGSPQLKSNIFIALPNEKESTFLTYNDGARLFLVRLVTGTCGHSANALDGIQTRAMG